MNFAEISAWLRKMLRTFTSEDEQLENHQRNTPRQQTHDSYENDIEVKTISYYPKQGSFRFPVQIDETKTIHQHIDQTSTKTKQVSGSESSQSLSHYADYSKPAKKRGPFVPVTDIPSPIYGYQSSQLFSEKEETNRSDSREYSETTRSAPTKQLNDDLVSSTPRFEPEEETKKTNEADTAEGYQHQLSDQADEEKPDFAELNKPEAVAAPAEVTNTAAVKQKTTSPVQTKKKTAQNDTPFNVMMTAKDKQSVKKQKNSLRGSGYKLPPLHLLNVPERPSEADGQWIKEQTERLNEAFAQFKIAARVVDSTRGPAVTQFEVQPDAGVKVNKIVNLADDLKLHLAAKDIRIEAPIPGKSTIGIEIPNASTDPVSVRKIMHSGAFTKADSSLTAAMGMDLTGDPVVLNMQEMPHGLVAGATGSGKSVCINSILISLLYRASPDEVRLLLIDPKMVELAPYRKVPHLAAPVITDPKEATAALKWAVEEMEDRYEKFMRAGVRDREKYNAEMEKQGKETEKMPYLLIVIDELADLMMTAASEVEDAICRIAQKARACGIHLLVATQRPSVDVITGLIKSNIPTRIAFAVSAQTDSRTILDCSGAEKLLGKGDMLMMVNGARRTRRVQGAFVSDEEIEKVTSFAAEQPRPDFLFEKPAVIEDNKVEDDDPLHDEVQEFVRTSQAASASLLQRRFRIGYNRAARLVDDLEAKGIVSPARGSKPREVYLTSEANSEHNKENEY